MQEVEAVKTTEQRQQIEAHLVAHDSLYADIWKVGVNTALRISDLLSLTMEDVRSLNADQPALNIIEQKTGKPRKIVVNTSALDVMQRRLSECPDHVWCFSRRLQTAIDAHHRNRSTVDRCHECLRE